MADPSTHITYGFLHFNRIKIIESELQVVKCIFISKLKSFQQPEIVMLLEDKEIKLKYL